MKISRLQKEAIAALLAHPSVTVAASVVGIPLQTLHRWMKSDKEFIAAYKAARRAESRQTMGRLRQGATGAAKSIRKEMIDRNGKPATRLKAAMIVIGEAGDAIAMEDFASLLAEMQEAQTAGKPLGSRGKSRIAGHGAKFPRKKERAIAALLTPRSVAEAAAVAGIGTQTLYRWMEDEEFNAACLAAARSAFGPALILMQQGLSTAVSIVLHYSTDPAIPETTRLKAAVYVYRHAKAEEAEDLRAEAARLDPASAEEGSNEPQRSSKTIGRHLRRMLQRIKTGLSAANWPDECEYFHAADGRMEGSSVIGIDGRHVWLKPPEGCKTGEPVREEAA